MLLKDVFLFAAGLLAVSLLQAVAIALGWPSKLTFSDIVVIASTGVILNAIREARG